MNISSKKKNNTKKIFIIAAAVVVAVIAALIIINAQKKKEEPVKPSYYKVTRQVVQTTISSTGVIEPSRTVDVKSNVGGEIVELSVDEGDFVTSGKVIARIDPSDSESTARQSMADLESAKSRVNQSQINLELTKEQLPTQIQQAQAAVQTAQLELDQAEKSLAVQKKTTQANINAAQQRVATTKIKMEQAKIESDQQPVITKANIDKSEASLKLAESALKQVKGSGTPQKLVAAESAYAQALSTDTQNQNDLKRQEELYSKGYISLSAVESAREKAINSSSALKTAKEKLDTISIEIDDDITSAELNVKQAELSLQTAKLGEVDVTIKKNNYLTAQSEYADSLDSLEVAKANALQDQIKANDILTSRSNLKTQELKLKDAQVQLKQVNVSEADVVQAQAAVVKAYAQAQNSVTQLNYTTIVAPTSGIVLTKEVEQGTIVSGSKNASAASTTLITIADISEIYVTVNIDETDIKDITLGQKVNVSIDAYPDENFTGEVIKISPTTITDQNITTVPVKVLIHQSDAKLKPGMNATCDFILEEAIGVLGVLNRAIERDENGKQFVMVKKGSEEVKVMLETGLVGAAMTEVKSGIKEGDEVLIPAGGGGFGASDNAQGNSRGGGVRPGMMMRR